MFIVRLVAGDVGRDFLPGAPVEVCNIALSGPQLLLPATHSPILDLTEEETVRGFPSAVLPKKTKIPTPAAHSPAVNLDATTTVDFRS